MTLKTAYGVYENCFLRLNHYRADESLYVGLYDDEGPVATLTVCLEDSERLSNESYLDVNNVPEAVDFVREYGLAELTGEFASSGFCWYPVVIWNMDTLAEYEGGK